MQTLYDAEQVGDSLKYRPADLNRIWTPPTIEEFARIVIGACLEYFAEPIN